MAIPATPNNFYVTQGNGQVLLQWAASAGATSYSLQRSTDGVNYTSLATVSVGQQYVDTTVSLNTQYYYQVASTNGSGTSPYTAAQSVIPTRTGVMSLAEVRNAALQRADRVGTNFVTLPELNSYINQSYTELYDLLVTTYEDIYVATPAMFYSDGTTFQYPLPDGSTSFYNGITQTPGYIAPAFYKLMGVDLGLNTANNAYVTVNKFVFNDRNKYIYPNTASTIYGVFNLQYRLLGNTIEFIPTPSANQPIRLWYIPRVSMLLKDTDPLDGISGWTEYVITDVAIKILQKEESDVSVLAAQKADLAQRIRTTAVNRDAGMPDKISDVRGNQGWGGYGSFDPGFKGGF